MASIAGKAMAACGSCPCRRRLRRSSIENADREPGQWLTTGRTYGEQRFSALAEIDVTNVAELGLAWYADLGVSRAQESTPLFIDGVLYVTTAWSNVHAYDARTGERLWSFDADVPGEWGSRACCDVVNGSPWNRALRSPGGGDNLFLSSIVALDPDDGSYLALPDDAR